MNSVTKIKINDGLVSISKACKEKGLSSIFIELGIESGALDCHHEEKNGRLNRQILKKQLEAYLVEQESNFVSFHTEAGLETYMAHLSQKGSASITTNPINGSTFRDVIIEGMRFQAFVGSNGPAIKNVVPGHNYRDGGSAPLGNVAEIHYLAEFPSHIKYCPEKKPGWWLCKYGSDEPLINISSLTEAGLHTLAFQFGIPIFPSDEANPMVTVPVEWTYRRIFQLPNGGNLFFLSPSHKDLCAWAQNHHRQIRSSQFREDYLRGWKASAIKGRSFWQDLNAAASNGE